MIHPESGRSSIQQLNMGEGKSSVIVPLVAATLADGKSLARVVVLKPLATQMFNILVQRLSGLAQRRVYYLPFSRGMVLGDAEARVVQELLLECARNHGVLVAQPEHILSFRLMTVLKQIDSSPSRSLPDSVSSTLRTTHQWLTEHSRDVLDESDEILQVKYQLVYTMGSQQAVDDHPNRWLTTQQALSRAQSHIPAICKSFPEDIIIEETPNGRYHRVKLLKGSAETMLIMCVAEDALNGWLTTCPQLALLPATHRSNALSFIAHPELTEDERQGVQSLQSHYGEEHSAWKTLLLLRGLLAYRIISYALGNRQYRVDYGLDPTRSLMAVPYRAKDVPSLRAEFGHPDVGIALTCLSYQYGGLTAEQVDQCFERLFSLDYRRQEYEIWTRQIPDLPSSLQDLDGVNLKDSVQRVFELQPLFCRCSGTIDFYLSNVVFPKYVYKSLVVV